jgi:hypothetical protein
MLIRGTHIPDTGAVQTMYVRIAVRIVCTYIFYVHTIMHGHFHALRCNDALVYVIVGSIYTADIMKAVMFVLLCSYMNNRMVGRMTEWNTV